LVQAVRKHDSASSIASAEANILAGFVFRLFPNKVPFATAVMPMLLFSVRLRDGLYCICSGEQVSNVSDSLFLTFMPRTVV
jgi:hypothetical protein